MCTPLQKELMNLNGYREVFGETEEISEARSILDGYFRREIGLYRQNFLVP